VPRKTNRNPQTIDEFVRWLDQHSAAVASWLRTSDEMQDTEPGDCAALVNEAQLLAYRLGVHDGLPKTQFVNLDHCEALAVFDRLRADCDEKPIREASLDFELTVQQAVKRINVSDQTIYRLVRDGELIGRRYGTGRGTIRIRLGDLLDYQRRQGAVAKSKTGQVTLQQLRSA
jgi:excisionase family DNA binding protein